MTQLTKLAVDRNPNLDISVLPNALGLVDLNLASTGLTDLLVLANTPNVTVLDISRNNVTDFTPLADLGNLTELRADRMTTPLTSLGATPLCRVSQNTLAVG